MTSWQLYEFSIFFKLEFSSFVELNIDPQFPQAVSGLGAHLPAPSIAPANIFVPPFVQDVPQPIYQPQPPQYTPPISAFPHDNHSHHQCGGHGHSHGYGESFLEIPQDHSVPAWDGGHYHHHQSSSDGLFGWFSNVGNKVFEKTKVA